MGTGAGAYRSQGCPKLLGQWLGDPEECDKALFLNHVVFDPVQALYLLFCINR